MRQRRIDSILLGISVGSFLLMSVSFLLMPIETMKIIPGLLFWVGLIFGVFSQVVLEVRRRAFFKPCSVSRRKMQKPRCGLLTFGSNWAARIVDSAMLVSVIAMITSIIITKGYGFVCYVFIATTVFSFCMHCVLNGRIYFHVKNQMNVRRPLEQMKANTIDKGEGENEKEQFSR